jgi:hypothetical protein
VIHKDSNCTRVTSIITIKRTKNEIKTEEEDHSQKGSSRTPNLESIEVDFEFGEREEPVFGLRLGLALVGVD